MSFTVDNLLGRLADSYPDREISDVQLRTGGLIYLHTNRGLEIVESLGPADADSVTAVAAALYSQQTVEIWDDPEAVGGVEKMWALLRSKRVIDFSCDQGALGSPVRMRVQVHLSDHGMGITCRCLRSRITQLESLGLDPMITDSLRELMQRRFGLGLVTGPTGSGKSTTLAAILDWVRRNFQKHIVTVEDPIEYRYDTQMEDPNRPGIMLPCPSLVTQQEVGRHTQSYQSGLKEVLRKTPNIILLGEIRDRETMETCIEAAQTGHFVISTLHTRGAVKTIDRILEFFPKEQQHAILHRLGETLTFVLSQGLLTGFNGRVLVTEYLQNTNEAVSSGIRAYDGSATSLEDALRCKGNQRWNQSLMSLYRAGRISEEVFNSNTLG
ncbi:MAG TPA: type IV pili twitching motility protein PilT [Verrucomicrobiales bacterium]|nr:type IV pili twitching motility protein PilT [Verrucomicrobiales bacterium]HRJ09146.1 ATPase, T2SS/T4P/T4SS family [Prosthecobacter sp.]HRK15632.1 ATPase, T2SS/T4P/T4SS family [Prosthecobacter sp.]